MKPPKHPVRTIVAIMVGDVAINVAIAALRGWGPDPWWQGPLSMIVFMWVFLWAWSGFAQPSNGPTLTQ